MNTSFQCMLRRPTKVTYLDEQEIHLLREKRRRLRRISRRHRGSDRPRELYFHSLEAVPEQLEACLQAVEVFLQRFQSLPAELEVHPQRLEVDLHEPEARLQRFQRLPEEWEVCLQELEVRPQELEVRLHEPEVDLQTLEVRLREPEVDLQGLELRLWNPEVHLHEPEVRLQRLEMRLQELGKGLRGLWRVFFYETAPLGLQRDRPFHRAALHLGFAEPQRQVGRHPGAW